MEKIKLFWDRVNEWHSCGKANSLRKGQLYFSILYSIDHELADRIQAVESNDPFYVDARIPKFLEVIHKEWNLI